MEKQQSAPAGNQEIDTELIRPPIRVADIRLRGPGMAPERLKAIKKGLRTLHTAETMAINVYKFQLASDASEFNRLLIAAMANEMTHLQDFQIKLYEYGWKPSKSRWLNWVISAVFGYVSRLRGKKAILQTGIWVENTATRHYDELIQTIEWDEDTLRMIKKNRADEDEHIARWQNLLRET
jgi:demethoxyubiquinone hydroxylase (CLK1/Coq7/Cat5 family)